MTLSRWLACGVFSLATIAAAGTPAEGTKALDDPYVWLEDVHGAQPLQWVHEQNERSRAALMSDPRYQQDYDAILSVLDATDRIPLGALVRRYVFNFWQDAQHPKGIWRRATIDDYMHPVPKWDTLLDLDKLATDEHENWVWKGAACAPSLKRCLVSLSRGGGDAVVVRELDLASLSFAKNGFALTEAKTDVSYRDDDTVLLATDFGKGSLTSSGYPRIVKQWQRGHPIADAKTIFEGKTEDVLVQSAVLNDGDQRHAIVVRAVSFFETEYSYLRSDGSLLAFPLPRTAMLQGIHRGQLLATLRKDWTAPDGTPIPKGALFSFSLQDFLASGKLPKIATLYVPDARGSLEQVATGRDAVYASIYENVTGSIDVFRFDATKDVWSRTRLDFPAGGSTHVVSANDFGPQAHFTFESFLDPTTLYADEGADGPRSIKSLPARFDATGLVTEQFEAVSRDGTKVPYFVVHAKGQSGPAPTVLYGYGGFEISLTPSYSANFGKLWVTKGGVYVVANIRGGGEFGPRWHEAALFENRQRAFDDFAAVAADLIKRGLTTPKQLGIMGGSNGGLLVSTVMTQHPELFGAVVCQVPLIDMIAYTHIGAGASWIGEYGDPADPKMREAILRYSPYQNVQAGRKYPPVLFVTATSDDRVTPVHARKMAAKMLAQGHDVLFHENTDGGHAAAADHKQSAEMWALSFVYLRRTLGL